MATLKLVRRIKLFSHLTLGTENSFPDRIRRTSFYQSFYQFFLYGKFEKSLLLLGLPDCEKASWFALFQSMLTSIDLLFSSEKITAINCSEILFTKNLYHIETSKSICIANHISKPTVVT